MAKGDVHPVSQEDQDVEPATFDEIDHQLTRIAEDLSDDELYWRIVSNTVLDLQARLSSQDGCLFATTQSWKL
jgi:hypothetical protein